VVVIILTALVGLLFTLWLVKTVVFLLNSWALIVVRSWFRSELSPVVLKYIIHFYHFNDIKGSLCSSGSIVSDYGLDDRAIGVRSPAGEKDFSSTLCVQTGSGAHPASCTMGTGGKERPGRDADHSPPSSAEVVNE
jgi:hypothetical protein